MSVYFEEIRCGYDNNCLFFGVVRRGRFGREAVTIIQLRYSRVEYLFIMYIILVCFIYFFTENADVLMVSGAIFKTRFCHNVRISQAARHHHFWRIWVVEARRRLRARHHHVGD